MKSEIYPYKLKIGTPTISLSIAGGNSQVLKGLLSDGTVIAIKEYQGSQQRIERMLSREQKAIEFLRENGLKNIPQILEIRADLGLIVYRWIEGNVPLANHETMSSILKMYGDLKEIYNDGLVFDKAIDAAFSIPEIHTQILNRIQHFDVTYSSPNIKILCSQINQRLNLCSLNQVKGHTFDQKTFSLSDLGTHNIIFSGSSYAFIDFEFFGVDSVNKLVGDFLLHPRNEFKEDDISRFTKFVSKISNWELIELNEVMPLLALKWAAIAYGRTFNQAGHKALNEISEELIRESKGTLYLEYFDSLLRGKPRDMFETFRSFEDRVRKS
jgi:tRNA A-37 threonylcarbamoyl transferase component Bud32